MRHNRSLWRSRSRWELSGVILAGACGVWLLLGPAAAALRLPERQAPSEPAPSSAAAIPKYPVRIRAPERKPAVVTGVADAHGQRVSVACSSCHTNLTPNAENRATADLDQFHQGLKIAHANLACVACHNSADGYASLRLAEGKPVAFPDVMTLCAQCHGTQYRDYQHGAHGGMTGFWDLNRGPRSRNNCIDCHDPHAPKYPRMRPAPGPNDRSFPPHSEVGHD